MSEKCGHTVMHSVMGFQTHAVLDNQMSRCDIGIQAVHFKLGKDVANSFPLRFASKKLLNLQVRSLYRLIKSKPAKNPPNPSMTLDHH